jgi:hypothetical protein
VIWRRRLRAGAAGWLGLLALALNALVPVHIAFDLAEALRPAHHHHSASLDEGGGERRLLALLTGHRDADDDGAADRQGKRHDGACPVCSALGALAGFAAPAPAALAIPVSTGLPAAQPVVEFEPAGTPAAYRSRAPPVV